MSKTKVYSVRISLKALFTIDTFLSSQGISTDLGVGGRIARYIEMMTAQQRAGINPISDSDLNQVYKEEAVINPVSINPIDRRDIHSSASLQSMQSSPNLNIENFNIKLDSSLEEEADFNAALEQSIQETQMEEELDLLEALLNYDGGQK